MKEESYQQTKMDKFVSPTDKFCLKWGKVIAAVTSASFVSPHRIGYHLSFSFFFFIHPTDHHHWIYVLFSCRQNYICIKTLYVFSYWKCTPIHVLCSHTSDQSLLSSFTIKRRDMNDVTHSIMTCHIIMMIRRKKEIDSTHLHDLLFFWFNTFENKKTFNIFSFYFMKN